MLTLQLHPFFYPGGYSGDDSSSDEVYSDPADQLHALQDVASETAEANGGATTGGEEVSIFNEVANDFYDF